MEVLHPASWPRPPGFSHGTVAQGRTVFVAGQLGADPISHHIPDGFAAQARQALQNIVTVLREAGGSPEHVVEMTWYVTDLAAYRSAGRALGEAWQSTLGKHFPAMTLIQVSGLLDDRALLEVSATAVLP